MSTASELVEQAFTRLAARPGFVERPDQRQLALLLCDLIEGGKTGLFEAPTGLGKSLAALIPAIAHGIANQKRIAIATYTNVLAEQYWHNDLPLALSLFDVPDHYRPQFLIGKQRYACTVAMIEHYPRLIGEWDPELGIETELRDSALLNSKQLAVAWRQIAAPNVCAGRFCEHFDDCYYYGARKAAQKAPLVITNHSIVMQDAIASDSNEGQGLLGEIDFLILDEAHDLPQAAAGSLEFELSPGFLLGLSGQAGRLEHLLAPRAPDQIARLTAVYRRELDKLLQNLSRLGQEQRMGILHLAPSELASHPSVKSIQIEPSLAKRLARQVAELTIKFTDRVQQLLAVIQEEQKDTRLMENAQSHVRYFDEASAQCARLFALPDVSVTHLKDFPETAIRNDIVDLAPALQGLLWSKAPFACLSATLALDGDFEFFRRTTGVTVDFEETLPSPFDFYTQAAAYLPPADRIPDPGQARKEGREDIYFDAVATELQTIIETLGGRTLALFHSRREMEAVAMRVQTFEGYPVHVQPKTGAASAGKRFLNDVNSSLFALRSFWTGFDAPGETLSCVVLVRVPFEVPFEPVSLTRMAYLQSQGLDPFHAHTLPQAKMLMRQGAGRLIRRADDKGIIVLLDPRLRTKAYGEAILANLPAEMRIFDDFADAAGWLGLDAQNPVPS